MDERTRSKVFRAQEIENEIEHYEREMAKLKNRVFQIIVGNLSLDI